MRNLASWHRSVLPVIALSLASVAASSTLAQSSTVTLAPSADTSVRLLMPFANDGTAPILSTSSASIAGLERTLVRFDQAAIAGAVGANRLVSATLEMTVVGMSASWLGGRVGAHQMTRSWTEAGATWACANDTVGGLLGNLINNCTTANRWGMDWTSWYPRPYEDTPTGYANVVAASADTVTFDVTADVRAFMTGEANHGWALIGTQDLLSGSWLQFASRESASGGPRLILTFEVPPPPPTPGTGEITVRIPTGSDTFVSELFPDWAREGSTRLKASSDQALFSKRALMQLSTAFIRTQMSASGVGDGYELLGANLVMTVRDRWIPLDPGHTIDVHRMTRAWDARGATWTCANDSDPSNLVRNCSAANTWSFTDADPARRPYAPLPSARRAVVPNFSGEIAFDVTDDVAEWLAGTRENHGFMVHKPDQPWLGFISFYSTEGGIPPRLELVFVRRECTTSAPCGEASGPCASDDQCAAGLECKMGVAWRFGITGAGGVCWNPICDDPRSALHACGFIDARCGLCDPGSCTADCSFRSCGSDGCYGSCGDECDEGEGGCNGNDDCAAGLRCGVGNGPRFGMPDAVRVCWQISCEALDQTGIPCGALDSSCGVCPECTADCTYRMCGSDSCSGSCGSCSDSETSCVESSGQCVANALTQFPLPADAQVTTQPVGTLPGDFAVTLNGDASYGIPIEVPPGINGMAPQLALRYDSSQSDGYLGIGWSLDGLSSIQRCPGTIAQDDGFAFPVMYNALDRLCLDGKRLVPVAQRDVGDDLILEFRTEIDTFVKVEGRYKRGATFGVLHGPFDFVAYAKDGHVMEYGTNDNSLIMGGPRLGPDSAVSEPDIHLWLLTVVRNRAGNACRIRYIDHAIDTDFGRTREVYPEAIYYGGHEEGRDPFVISFVYEDRESPGLSGWRDGVNVQTNKLLKRIATHVRGTTDRLHLLEYEGGGGGLDGSRARLASARLCNAAMVCKPPTRFEYDVSDATLWPGVELAGTGAFFRNDRRLEERMPRFVLDLNGDGIDDLLYPIYADGADFIDFIYTPDRWINWWTVMSHRTPTGGIERTVTDTGHRIAFAQGGSPLVTGVLLLTPLGRLCEPNLGGDPVGGDLCPIPGDFTSNSAGGVIDWNNDGRKDLIEYGQGNEFSVLMHDGNALQRFSTGIERDAGDAPYVIDVNGDGLDDLLVCNLPIRCAYSQGGAPTCNDSGGSTGWRIYLNDGGTGGIWFPGTPQVGRVGLHAGTMREVQTDLNCRRIVATMDVDGDKTEEVIVGLEGGGTIVVDIFAHASSSTSWVTYQYSSARGGGLKMDVNGDGLLDLVGALRDLDPQVIHFEIDINRGDGQFSRVNFKAPYPLGRHLLRNEEMIVWDENVDGKQDLIVPHPDGHWLVYRGSANGLEPARTLGTSFGRAPTPADMNGDAVQDIVDAVSGRLQVRYVDGPPQDLLTSVIDGLGARTSIEYSSASMPLYNHASFNSNEILCHYPHRCDRPRKMLVSEHRVYDESSEPIIPLPVQTYSYAYDAGRSHALGRGWLGFRTRYVERREAGELRSRQTLTFDNTTHLADRHIYPFAGLVKLARTETFVPSSVMGAPDEIWTSDTTHAYDIVYATPLSVYAPLARVDASSYVHDDGVVRVLSQSSMVVEERDPFGNNTRVVHDFGTGEVQTVERVFKHAEDPSFVSSWLVGLPSEEHVTATMSAGAGAGTKTRLIDYDYDDRGFLIAVVRQPGDPWLEHTTTYVRASDGLVESIEERDASGEERAVRFTYRAGERHYPARVTNALGHESVVAFDERFGHLVGVLDPNNLLTLFGYDDFGRTGVVLRPDGSRAWTLYEPGSEPNRPVVVDSFEVGGERARVELDVLGRPSRIRTWGLGNQELTEHLTYDDLGLLATRTRPSSASPPIERFKYDPLGRLLEHTGFRNEVTTRCYVGSTSCARDPRGHTRCSVTDGQGRPVRVTEPAGVPCNIAAEGAFGAAATTYAYGPFGLPHEVRDRAGNVIITTYDAYGRKLALHDPDRGTEMYRYNGFDELVRTVDGRGTVTELEHDALGRLELRRHRDQFGPGNHGESIYEWDGGPSLDAEELIGALTRTVSADGVEQRYSFDGSSGLLSRIRTTADGMSFDVDYAYDAFARVERVTYPQGPTSTDRLAVQNIYDTYGHVMGLADANAPPTQPLHWAITGTNLEGAVQAEQYGNGSATTRFYYPDGRARQIIHHVGNQRFQAYEYDYDLSGNLNRRTDTVRNQSESFLYDEHDRVRLTSGGGLQWFEYDQAGNVHPDSVNASYRYDGPRPHALTSDGTSTFQYDGAGNRTARIHPGFTYRYSYTPFNKLQRIEREESGDTEVIGALKYDALDNRVTQTSSIGTVHYGLDLYERRHREGGPVEHVFYISAPGRTVAQVIWREGADPQIFYLHDDHLGSTTSLTPQVVGDLSTDVVEQSFGAFGERRAPFDWSISGSWVFPDPRFRREYTGHESDHLFGLINMRGRMYDPSTRQFLSPDPYMQLPFGEGLNRYSYVWNNPLRYIDPSGYQAVTYQNFDVGTTITVQSYTFGNTLVLSGVSSIQSNVAVGATPSPALSADSGHYQHLAPSNSSGLMWGASFDPSLLTQVSENNPKFKEWEDLGHAYQWAWLEILDWLCLDGQCGPGGTTAAIGALRTLRKEAIDASRAGAFGAQQAIKQGLVREGGKLAQVLQGVEAGVARQAPRNATEALSIIKEATGRVGLEPGVASVGKGGEIILQNVGNVTTTLGAEGSIVIQRGSDVLLRLLP